MPNTLASGRDFLLDWNPAPVLHLDSDLEIEYANQSAKNAICTCGSVCSCPEIICSCSDGKNLLNALPSMKNDDAFFVWHNDAPEDVIYYFEETIKNRIYHFTCRKLPGGCMNIYGSDITEVKRMQQEKEDMERIVKHDLKNPLNGILGLTELLADEIDPEEKIDMLEDIRTNCREMLYLINHEMDIYKMEEGKYIVKPESFDIVNVIGKLHADWHDILEKRDIRILYSYDGQNIDFNRSFFINGEIHHIRNMIANLVVNAIEASPDGGSVRLNIISASDNMMIDIHNEGEIVESVRGKFFERYATSGKTNGTGLGTYSARLVARAHGGDISFTTSKTEGTNLKIILH